jgi:hypothetical protein
MLGIVKFLRSTGSTRISRHHECLKKESSERWPKCRGCEYGTTDLHFVTTLVH